MNQVQETPFERKMAMKNQSIVTIKNPSKEDFQHTYDGIPYTIQAGESLPFPYPVGMLMAKHLAMRIIRELAAKEGKLAGNADKKSVNLYTGPKVDEVLLTIIMKTEVKPLEPRKTEGQVMKDKTDELHKNLPDEANKKKVTKKEILAELRSRNIKFNARLGIDELSKLLIDSEMRGEGSD